MLTDRKGGVGYLLKDRVSHVAQFVDAVRRVAAGGTAMDPEVVSQLLARHQPPLAALTTRERDVIGLMAEGRSNGAIAAKLFIGEKAVSKHINSIFTKLALPPCDPRDPSSIPSDAQSYMKLPPNTKVMSVELTYRDGTTSEVKTFRADPRGNR